VAYEYSFTVSPAPVGGHFDCCVAMFVYVCYLLKIIIIVCYSVETLLFINLLLATDEVNITGRLVVLASYSSAMVARRFRLPRHDVGCYHGSV